MPRLERSVLIGYGVEVRRAKGMVPAVANREQARNGESPGMVEIEATELVFTDNDGDQIIWPTDEAGRVELVEQLTGVRIVT